MSVPFALRATALGAAFLLSSCHRPTAAGRVLVTNEDAGTVSVIDSSSDVVVATIPVGKRPRGIRISSDGKRAYVAVSGSPKSPPGAPDSDAPAARDDAADGIAVIDIEHATLLQKLPAGRDPEAFDVSADEKTLYVSNEETATLSVVDIPGRRIVRTVSVGREPEGVTLSPDGRFVYVTSEAASEVAVVACATGEVTHHLTTAMRPRVVTFTPDGSQALVTAELGGVLHFVDATSQSVVGQVATGASGAKPMGIAVSPDGLHAYVANGRQGSVAVIDLPARRLERTIEGVGKRPWGLALTPDGKKLYVAALPDIAVIDVSRGIVAKRIPAGAGPWGVAFAPSY